jgi:hypothetical protein
MNQALKLSLATILILCVPLAIAAHQSSAPGALPPNVAGKLAFGKSAYIKNEHGGNLAFEAISSDIEGWGRFVLVDFPDKADFVVAISSYEGGSVSSNGHTDYATPDGKPKTSSGASKDLSGSSVTMKIYEPKTQRELWSGAEKVKSALKKKAEEDNMVAAAEKLFLRFHDTVEPPAK